MRTRLCRNERSREVVKMSLNVDTVLFDLDGTLIDTNELIIRSFQHALRELLPELQRVDIIPQMGRKLADQLRYFSGWEDVEPLLQAYREYNVQHHNELARIFPHVADVLQTLRKAGIRVGVVTTKMRASTERSLRFFGVERYIETIVSVEEVEHAKPHPEPVLLALERLNGLPERAVMVGDSPVDLLAAQAAGVRAIGVAWSLKGPEELRKYPPVTVIETMAELLPHIGFIVDVQKK